ncbi:MAG: ABC transporter ATP-binding protein [Betaproteobacteria bacterium]|nr:ABC transporter ATP-binding protein [Betaproteobacteria bacterium]
MVVDDLPSWRNRDAGDRHQPDRRRRDGGIRTVTTQPTLELRDLRVAYRVRGIDREVLRGISLSIQPGEAYGLVGESGCGKSTAAFAAMRYLPRNGSITSGSIHFEGKDITSIGDDEIRELRTNAISMVYQNPIAALNPTIRVGKQVAEVYELLGKSADEARELSLTALKRVQIADAEAVLERYPHQLSGGMRQRAAMARTLAVDPLVLLMDEPFSALDAQTKMILQQDLARTVSEQGKTVLFITHDLAEAVALSDRILVMSERPGTIVEQITVDIPDRNNPMQRRKYPEVGAYVARLMDLLKLDANTEVH